MAVPIAYFAFNRPDHARRSLAALAANALAAESDLFIFCDGPRSEEEKKKTDAVRESCRAASGFKSVTLVEREENWGCGKGIFTRLDEFFSAHPAGVVVEDDIVLAPNALRWFNTCLERYAEEPAVFSIIGWSYPERYLTLPAEYPYDAYFSPRFSCGWGWASWADRMRRVDWEVSDYEMFVRTSSLVRAFVRSGADLLETLKSQRAGTSQAWDVQAAYASFKHGQVSLAPRFAYATNIGTVGEGTHVTPGHRHPTLSLNLDQALDAPKLPEHIFVDEEILRRYMKALPAALPSFWLRATNKLKRMLGCA